MVNLQVLPSVKWFMLPLVRSAETGQSFVRFGFCSYLIRSGKWQKNAGSKVFSSRYEDLIPKRAPAPHASSLQR